jgi:hypothetical protein
VQFIPAGTPLFVPDDSGKYFDPYKKEMDVTKIIKELKKKINEKEVDGLVIKLEGVGNKFWVPKDSLKPKSYNGYVVSSGTTEYWVSEENIEKSAAGFVQAEQDAPLFPEEGPKPEHVLQGTVGDCYLMAAVASITAANPDYPKDMMRDNGDGTVTVRLYNVTKSSNFYNPKSGEYASKEFEAKEQYIRINKSVAKDNGRDLYAQKNLWVQMIEKAYAASGQGGNLLEKAEKAKKGSYDNIVGGSSKFAFEVLLGKEASSPNLTVKKEKQGGDAIFTQISQALKEGKAVAAGTRQISKDEQSEGLGHSAGEKKLGGIVAGHAYTVLLVHHDTKEIIVRNPWGEYGRTAQGKKEDKGNGTFSLPLNEFLNWFDSLYISGKVEKLPDN